MNKLVFALVLAVACSGTAVAQGFTIADDVLGAHNVNGHVEQKPVRRIETDERAVDFAPFGKLLEKACVCFGIGFGAFQLRMNGASIGKAHG